MSINWDLYEDRLIVNGSTERDRAINSLQTTISNNIINSPSYQSVSINGSSKNVVIIELSETDAVNKQMLSLPNQTFYLGDLVVWNSEYWIVTEIDNNNEVYTNGIITQSNYVLKFQNQTTGEIISRPCIFDKSTGNAIDEGNVLSVGNQERILRLPLDSETQNLRIGYRLIVDLDGVEKPNTFKVSNPDPIGGYSGILFLTLTQDEFNAESDNATLMVCDYFTPPSPAPEDAAYCTITYSGDAEVKIGGSSKIFTATFYNTSGDEVEVEPIWTLTIPTLYTLMVASTELDNNISISVTNNMSILGQTLALELDSADGTYHTELSIAVVGMV